MIRTHALCLFFATADAQSLPTCMRKMGPKARFISSAHLLRTRLRGTLLFSGFITLSCADVPGTIPPLLPCTLPLTVSF